MSAALPIRQQLLQAIQELPDGLLPGGPLFWITCVFGQIHLLSISAQELYWTYTGAVFGVWGEALIAFADEKIGRIRLW